MKRKLLILTALCLTILACLAFSFTVSAEEAAPAVSIEKFNLAFEDNTYIKYAVKFTGIDDEKITENNIGMLYWKDTDDGFVPGTEDFSSITTGYTEISGEKYYVFKYTNMVAKQLADYVYSVAYLEYDGETYYSAPVKFSALEYCYSKLGKTGEASENADFRNLLTATLEQGAAAQKYFKYNTDRLANAEYYQINLVGGTLDDGFTSGLFLSTDKVTITAPEMNGDLTFAGWKNSAGEIKLTSSVAVVENLNKNETYTATYKIFGLEFAPNGDGTCYVSGIGAYTDTDIIIPTTSPAGYRVTGIADQAFDDCKQISSVQIPSGITYIGEAAFYNCSNITYVILPDTLTDISPYAFLSCTKLKSFYYTGDQTKWGSVSIGLGNTALADATVYCYSENEPMTEGAFWHYNENGEIEVWPEYIAPPYSVGLEFTSNGDGTCSVSGIGTCKDANIVIPSTSPEGWTVTSIGVQAFKECTNIKSIGIPDSVTSIYSYAFYGCSNLASIEIPADVTYIDDYAFYACTGLKRIDVDENNSSFKDVDGVLYTKDETVLIVCPAGISASSFVISDRVRSVANYAFYGCSNITSIEIPSSVTSIGDYAFYGCTSLASIEIPNSVTVIGSYAFVYCVSLESIEIPGSVTGILDGTFMGCEALTSVVVGNGVQNIGSNAFLDCIALTDVTIPDSVTSIGKYAFSRCTSLTSIVIPNGITVIEKGVFSECSALTSIVISNSITGIDSYAFYYCPRLTDVYYKGTAAEWEKITVDSSNTVITNANLYYYSETQPTEEGSFWHCNENGEIEVWPAYVAPKYSEGLEFTSNGDGTCYVSGIGTCTDTEIVIPPTSPEGWVVTSIGDRAFQERTAITSIVIPDSVTNIGSYAFWCCIELSSVVIGKNVETIGAHAFNACRKLTSINIPDSVNSIGAWAFFNCYRLTSIVIPDSLTSLGNSAFHDCSNLTTLIIGKGITSIGREAFYGCSRITDIYYTGTEEEWNAINIESYNDPLTLATIHYNYVSEE